jgi:hypothetical protein
MRTQSALIVRTAIFAVVLSSFTAAASAQGTTNPRAFSKGDNLLIIHALQRAQPRSILQSGNLPSSAEELILCLHNRKTGLVSVHRVPWNLSLSGNYGTPQVSFDVVNNTVTARVEGEIHVPSPFGTVPGSNSNVRFLIYEGLSGFRWCSAPDDALPAEQRWQRLTPGEWEAGDEHRKYELVIDKDLILVSQTLPSHYELSLISNQFGRKELFSHRRTESDQVP